MQNESGLLLSPNMAPQPRNSVDLQKMLIDERIRCETHKTNYQTIKEEHKRLQDEHIKLQEDIAKLHSRGAESAEQLQVLVQNLQNEIASKAQQLEEAQSQILNPSKLEAMKAEIAKELEEPLKVHMLAMDKEVEKYRSEYNKVRYEHTFLKAEYEHAKSEYQRSFEEQQLRYQAQIAVLQQERDTLLEAQKSTSDVDSQKLLHLQRQKTQLEQRVKNLLDELSEVRKQKDHAAREADLIQRTQSKDLSKLHTDIKEIQSEKRSCEMQCERFQKELKEQSERNTRMSRQVQDLNKEITSIRSLADEESHRHKMQTSELKMQMLKTKGDLEREKDSLYNKLHEIETELEVSKLTVTRHHQVVEDLERDASRRVQEAQQEEWNKNNQLHNEKLQLEENCRALERQLHAEKTSVENERAVNEERQQNCDAQEMALRSEISQLKIRLEHEQETRSQLERDREQCVLLRQKLDSLDAELKSVSSSRQQAISEAERAKEALRLARSDADSAKLNAVKSSKESERVFEESRLTWLEEKHGLQRKMDEMQHKLLRLNERYEKDAKHCNKMKKVLAEKMKKARRKNELLEAEKEQLEIRLKAGRHGVSMEEFNQMRRRMREHRRRHVEFQRVINLSEALPQFSETQDTLYNPDFTTLSIAAEDQNTRKKIENLKQRVDWMMQRSEQDKENCDVTAAKRDSDNYDDDFETESNKS